jgi:hypothetical protein
VNHTAFEVLKIAALIAAPASKLGCLAGFLVSVLGRRGLAMHGREGKNYLKAIDKIEL